MFVGFKWSKIIVKEICNKNFAYSYSEILIEITLSLTNTFLTSPPPPPHSWEPKLPHVFFIFGHMHQPFTVKEKVKQPYFTSITRDSLQLTNSRSTVHLFYLPQSRLCINAPFLRVSLFNSS